MQELTCTDIDTVHDGLAGRDLRLAILHGLGRWFCVTLEEVPHTPGFPGGGTVVEVHNRVNGAKVALAVGSDLIHGLVVGDEITGYTRELVEKLLAEIA